MSRYVVRVVQRDGVARYWMGAAQVSDMTADAVHYKHLPNAWDAVDMVRVRFPPGNVIVDVIDLDEPESTVEQP